MTVDKCFTACRNQVGLIYCVYISFSVANLWSVVPKVLVWFALCYWKLSEPTREVCSGGCVCLMGGVCKGIPIICPLVKQICRVTDTLLFTAAVNVRVCLGCGLTCRLQRRVTATFTVRDHPCSAQFCGGDNFVVASKNNEKIPGNLLKNLEKSWKYHGILISPKKVGTAI